MRRFLYIIIVAAGFALSSSAQEKTWVDVTDRYITNPRYDGNKLNGWSGTALGAVGQKENAEHYSKTYDTYQTIQGLKSGQYRLSLNAFYRMGSAQNDYWLFSSGNYSSSQHALLYASSSQGEITQPIVPASSAALAHSPGGGTQTVGNMLYVPNNMEAAYYWFEAGYYNNSLQCSVGADGKLTIGIRKSETINADWTCIDNWKLEYYTTLVKASSITLNNTAISMVPYESTVLTATILPSTATYSTVEWSTSNKSVCTVSSTGELVALATGEATITATAKDGSGVKGECKIKVEQPAQATAQNIIINELMAANVDVYRDKSTNFGSWVELYNPTDKGVNLGGLYVTDDATNLKKHRLVDYYGALPAHGYAVLDFDHKEIYTKAAWRQIDDKLSTSGGTIIISDGTNIIAQQAYPAAISRASYARLTDGATEWGTTSTPTPGLPNGGGFATERLAPPDVTPNGGLFSGTQTIKVTIPEGTILRYTVDGSAPTMSNGYTSTTGQFTISRSMAYRFRLFKDGMLPSEVVTRTYINNNGSEVFPIISVVAAPGTLFDSEYAIFEYSNNGRTGNGQNTPYNANMDWDRPVNFEYITTDNECVINQECDFSACGGWSRAFSPHSFKLKAGKAYEGLNSFDYQFFKEKPFLKHKTLQIRNGGNDNGGRIKDAAVQQVIARSGLYVEYQSWQPVHVYFNAQPYAVLNMREPNNKHYGQTNYGIDTDLMDQFEICPDSGYVQKEGTATAYNRWHELSANAADPAIYNEICRLVDIDEFANYMAAEFCAGGTDWPQNNVKAFRSTDDGKFRFVIFDLDFALNTSEPFNNFFGKQYYTFDSMYGYDWSTGQKLDGQRITEEIKLVTIFKGMLKNDTFRKKFIDAYCLVNGSVLTPERVKGIVSEMNETLSKGGVNSSGSANSLINGFTTTRQQRLISHLKATAEMQLSGITPQQVSLQSNISGAAITLNDQQVPTGSFSGQLFAPITITASAPAGYEFKGWQTAEGTTVSTAKEYTLPTTGSHSLTAVWQAVNTKEMQARAAVPVKINEASPANDMYVNEYIKKDDWIELYNTTDTDIDANGLFLSDNPNKPEKYQITAQDGINTIIPAHGHLIVWCSKRNAVSQLHAPFKLGNDDGTQLLLTAGGDFAASNTALYKAHPDYPQSFTDTLTYNSCNYDESVGRFPDGSNNIFAMHHPTICKANSLQQTDRLLFTDATYIIGDANCDGIVNQDDVSTIMLYFIGTLPAGQPFNEKAADVNGDGVITVADANAIRNMR